MRSSYILLSLVIATLSFSVLCTSCSTRAEDLGWKLAVQSYSFHDFSFVETLDKCSELGVKYIEAFPGHTLGEPWGDAVFGPSMNAGTRREILALAEEKGVRIVSSGVFTSDDLSEWEDFFSFAADMKMEYITCEPPLEFWDMIENFSESYGIRIAVHNHPRPSLYWDPENLLDAINGRNHAIGSCADVGHWNRMGLNHLDCLKKLEGRIVSLHFKDIVAEGADTEGRHDCIWGSGVLDVPAMLKILQDQGFKGYFAIEYEYNWGNSLPDIKQCIDYFNKTVQEVL